jgi:ECF transporter S component (folate family)
MALFLQVITFLTIVGLGILTFKFFPLKITTKNLTLAAMLVVLSVALQFFSVMIPLFGFPSLRIDFLQLPLMIIGVLLGPTWAFVSGIVQDVLGLVVTPTGFPFFGFMLNKVLVGMIPAVLFLKKDKIDNNTIHRVVMALLGLFLVGALSYLWSTQQIIVEQSPIEITTTMKLTLSIVTLVLISTLGMFVQISKKRYVNVAIPVAYWTLSVLLVEVIVQLILTPTWLSAMYGIPVLISFLVRVVKAAVMIPLMMFVGYGVLQLLNKIRI